MLDRIERFDEGHMREVTDSVAHDLRDAALNRLRNLAGGTIAGPAQPTARKSSEIERAIAETDQLIGTFNALAA